MGRSMIGDHVIGVYDNEIGLFKKDLLASRDCSLAVLAATVSPFRKVSLATQFWASFSLYGGGQLIARDSFSKAAWFCGLRSKVTFSIVPENLNGSLCS